MKLINPLLFLFFTLLFFSACSVAKKTMTINKDISYKVKKMIFYDDSKSAYENSLLNKFVNTQLETGQMNMKYIFDDGIMSFCQNGVYEEALYTNKDNLYTITQDSLIHELTIDSVENNLFLFTIKEEKKKTEIYCSK